MKTLKHKLATAILLVSLSLGLVSNVIIHVAALTPAVTAVAEAEGEPDPGEEESYNSWAG